MVALLLFLAIAAGFAWQVEAGGGGLVSFIGQSGAAGSGPLRFVLAQLGDILPLLIVVAIAIGLRRSPGPGVVAETADLPRTRLYLTVMIAVPLLSAIAAAASTGAKDMWATPMLNLVGLGLVAAWPRRFDAVALRRIAVGAVVLVLLAPALFALRHVVTDETAANPMRTQWPQHAITLRFAAIWHQQTDAPLQIVGGDDWIAGLVSLDLVPRASVFYRLDPRLSPWVTPERAAQQGMLVVWPGEEPPDYAVPLLAGHVHGVEQIAWSGSDAARPIEIGYVIVPPQAVR